MKIFKNNTANSYQLSVISYQLSVHRHVFIIGSKLVIISDLTDYCSLLIALRLGAVVPYGKAFRLHRGTPLFCALLTLLRRYRFANTAMGLHCSQYGSVKGPDAINRRLYEGLMIVETPIYEPARCGEKLRAGVPPVEQTSEGSPRCSDWRRVFVI